MIASTSFGAFSGTTAAPKPAASAGASGTSAMPAASRSLAPTPTATPSLPTAGGVPRRGSLLDIQA